MIYACTILYNRLDLLEIWLNELKDVVDCFVIVESDTSWRGEKRQLCFRMEGFKGFPITYINVSVYPVKDSSPVDYRIEEYVTTQIMAGLKNCMDNDIIMFAHQDEIVRPLILAEAAYIMDEKYKENPKTEFFIQLHLYQMRYWLNCFLTHQNNEGSPYVTNFYNVKKFGIGNLKHISLHPKIASIPLSNAGWHYSWLAPKEYIVEKLRAITDQTYVKPEFFEDTYLDKVLAEGGDLLQEAEMVKEKWKVNWLETLNLNSMRFLYPMYVLKNMEKFKHLIKWQ